ncbi:MAG TPA: hypothetical protein PLB02_00100 [Thermoanaerobaculia bacterium]|nr:hypothetical protein [Thermoanaerobaculia bacterium]
MAPLQRLELFSDSDFENFVNEWVHDYLKARYVSVEMRRGAGDKGRDIVGWLDPVGTTPRRWDNYQCKHYKDRLTPSDIWIELGKLVFFVANGVLTAPRRYYFVTARGAGSSLLDLLGDPENLRSELKLHWEKHCERAITSRGSVALEGAVAACLESLDFSIFEAVSPSTLIEEHGHTRYHSLVFGLGLERRPSRGVTPAEVAPGETRYVDQFLRAASEETGVSLAAAKDLAGFKKIAQTFRHARESFYEAEQLKEFARDSLPDDTDFEELKEDVCDGVITTVNQQHANGYQRLLKTSDAALALQLDRSALREVLSSKHRVGVVHHLVNEERISWVGDDEPKK